MEDQKQAIQPAHSSLDNDMTNINSEQYTKLLLDGSIFEKTATIHARLAQSGEIVQTILADGAEETTNIAKEGDFIVTNPGGEEYIIRRENFAYNYEATDQEGVFKAKDLIRAIKNPTGKPIKIIASWGEAMNGDKECYIATGYDPAHPQEVGTSRYIIGYQEFADTYTLIP